MKLTQLSETTLSKIKTLRWDRIIEKHEGPETWESVFRYSEPEFMEIEGRWVLLPVESSSHANITILRTIWSNDGNSLTIFLKDTTYEDDPFFSGFLAVCDRLVNEKFYVAVVYHEWFVIDNQLTASRKTEL
ncbi:unknown [Crocosphaera subtropica ATCC 51142]|uniref:Uncharacterized protein n=1 Tax=Crocosphaera subtropica (strain ATCC 51142 / BH68) TaxID=43989 RepID=B1X2Q8_CROS5|nr:hypothetical protein [Crocosphaera subtropica]ACB54419.1 unknown [Crocosphaera subtropica ATCC 51142]